MSYEPTTHAVLERVDTLTVKVDTLVSKVDALASNVDTLNVKVDTLNVKMDEGFEELLSAINLFAENVDERFDLVDQRFQQMDSRLNKVEATMVTKEYLDTKLADLRGDLILLARKSNRKFESLVEELVQEGRLAPKAARLILALEPFPLAK